MNKARRLQPAGIMNSLKKTGPMPPPSGDNQTATPGQAARPSRTLRLGLRSDFSERPFLRVYKNTIRTAVAEWSAFNGRLLVESSLEQ
jgi:hypothetical protein